VKKLLTTKFVASVETDKKREEFTDTRSPNLVLVVQKTGTKSWAWRGFLDGANKKVTLGSTTLHSLDAAREWADAITLARDAGVNLIEQDKQEKAEAEAQAAVIDHRTCDWMFDLYMEAEGRTKKSAKEKQRIYDKDIKPVLGTRLVDTIEHNDLAKILRLKAKTAPIASNAIQSLVRRWFKWAVTTGRDLTGMTADPSINIVKLTPPRSRERFLNDYEIGIFFRAVAKTDLAMGKALILILYTGTRRSEAFEMPWSEMDFHKGIWFIPGSRTKNGLDHLLPLPGEMIALLEEQKRKSGNSVLVWPSEVVKSDEGDHPMSGFSDTVETIHLEMEKMAKEDGKTIASWCIHDLRRSLSSGMNGLLNANEEPLIPQHIVERVINHKLGGVAGTYNRHEYLAEKRKALKLWADHLTGIKRVAEQRATR
jgi:integrase